jgi:hypothetical protein
MITLHAADKQRISIQSTKVIMSLITQRNGFIFKGYFMTRGTAVAQWLRSCATNRKVAGSNPAGVTVNFH